jgi:hypothetical protein
MDVMGDPIHVPTYLPLVGSYPRVINEFIV